MCKKCENKQAVHKVQKLVLEAIATDSFKEAVELIAREHDEPAPALLIQGLSIASLKIASSGLKTQGMNMGTFIAGDDHFVCLAQTNMLTHSHPRVAEGGQMLLAQVAESLGIVDMVEKDIASVKKEEQEPSINELLAKEIMEEAGL